MLRTLLPIVGALLFSTTFVAAAVAPARAAVPAVTAPVSAAALY